MTAIYLHGVGVLGRGLPDWSCAKRILAGHAVYDGEPLPNPHPDALPPNERRRGAMTVRWAVAAAQQALLASGIAANGVATVFTSSSGDGETLHHMCETLASPGREVSPTRFHNAVHNAPAGYWSIAAQSHAPSVTLCGHDASFAAGLLEAAAQLNVEAQPVLLVAYDLPYPEPLHAVRTVAQPFAVALLLLREPRPGTIACWRIAVMPGAARTRFPDTLPPEIATNPAAHALSLLAPVARSAGENVAISYVNGCHLRVETQPWS